MFAQHRVTDGRIWLSRDPSGESSDLNLYQLYNGDPVNLSDSRGLAAGGDEEAGGESLPDVAPDGRLMLPEDAARESLKTPEEREEERQAREGLEPIQVDPAYANESLEQTIQRERYQELLLRWTQGQTLSEKELDELHEHLQQQVRTYHGVPTSAGPIEASTLPQWEQKLDQLKEFQAERDLKTIEEAEALSKKGGGSAAFYANKLEWMQRLATARQTYRASGGKNVAMIDYSIQSIGSGEKVAFSGNSTYSGTVNQLPEKPMFKTLPVEAGRDPSGFRDAEVDSERKLLEWLAAQIKDRNASGSVELATEFPCARHAGMSSSNLKILSQK